MIDFTSALYLGMGHASRSLPPWPRLTTGAPAALADPHGAREVARELALLQGCERATLAPSTLHLFWDLFGVLSRGRVRVYTDAGLYPIARWGVERAAACGARLRSFPHFGGEYLRRLLKREAGLGGRPLIVTDGYCPSCGRPAPLADYLECARASGGYLIVDDTQAIGIFGHSPGRAAPYGSGGGGMLRWHHIQDPSVMVVSSYAKGFGVPVAALCGGGRLVGHFEEQSETRVHCSPPSSAVISALRNALALNRERGDGLRSRLALLVGRFRRRLVGAGFSAVGGLFPVQTLRACAGLDAAALFRGLSAHGVRTVLHRGCAGPEPRLSFIITALHQPRQLDSAVQALAGLAPNGAAAMSIRDSLSEGGTS